MYFPQTYGGKSTLYAGACRGVETGAEGQLSERPTGGKSEFMEKISGYGVKNG